MVHICLKLKYYYVCNIIVLKRVVEESIQHVNFSMNQLKHQKPLSLKHYAN